VPGWSNPIDYPFLDANQYTIGEILDAFCWQP
jgi:hypothetical protein